MSGNYTMFYPALSPLYDFSHWFLGSVLQSKTLGDIKDEIDLSDPAQIIQDFTSNWQIWVTYFLGFAILAGLGICYLFFFSVSGICVCSCRNCCGKCGVKGSKKHGKCKSICCSVSLLCLVFVIFLGVVWSVMANYAIWEETKEGEGALHDLQVHLETVDEYRVTTTDEIELLVLRNFDLAKNSIYSLLDNAGPSITYNLGAATNAKPALDGLQAWTESLPGLQEALQNASDLTAALQTNGNQLATELATLQSDVITDAGLCSSFEQLCVDLEQMAINIKMGVDYSELQATEISVALASVTYAINDDIWGSIESGINAFSGVGDDINTKLEPSITVIKTNVDVLEGELQKYTDLVIETSERLTTANLVSTLQNIEPDVEKYGAYWFWSAIGLSSILGLITLFYYWGLMLGSCCCKKSKSCCCSRKTASKCLLSANCCSFVFGWLLMLVTTACFLSGGPAYTEICRHLTSLESSTTIEVIDDMLTSSLGFNLSISYTVAECRNNSPAYQALDLERYDINITEILDLDQYNIKEELDALKQVQIDVGTVTILTEQANETLLVALTGLNALNFTWNYLILQQEVVMQNLEELALTLDAAANAVAVLEGRFQTHANTSRELNSGLVKTIISDNEALNQTLHLIEQGLNAYPLNELILNISVAQENLNLYGNDYVSGMINSSVDELYLIMVNGMNELETTITEEVGRCESLYDALTGMIDVACVQVLDPFNAFWLAYGWSLWLLIPCVIIGYSLADHYKRSMKALEAEDSDTISLTSSNSSRTSEVAAGTSNSPQVISAGSKRNSVGVIA